MFICCIYLLYGRPEFFLCELCLRCAIAGPSREPSMCGLQPGFISSTPSKGASYTACCEQCQKKELGPAVSRIDSSLAACCLCLLPVPCCLCPAPPDRTSHSPSGGTPLANILLPTIKVPSKRGCITL